LSLRLTLLPAEVDSTTIDDNGIKTVIEYKTNDKGQKVKVCPLSALNLKTSHCVQGDAEIQASPSGNPSQLCRGCAVGFAQVRTSYSQRQRHYNDSRREHQGQADRRQQGELPLEPNDKKSNSARRHRKKTKRKKRHKRFETNWEQARA
jgi:hypothetical protein